MPRTKISEFSATPANNTDIDSINISEGCAPSGINDAIRELMAQLKDWQAGTSNDPYVVGSSGSLTLNQGTANGVLYLNGSKVATSGSALTFDGSNFFGGTNIYASGRFYAQRSSSSLNLPIAGYTDGSAGTVLSGTKGDIVAFGNAGGDGVIFANNNTEQMRLNTTGLGIGTSSPAVKLDVAGSIRSIVSGGTPAVYLNNGSTQHSIQNESGAFTFYNSGVKQMTLDSSGNLGLGVTPSAWGSFRVLDLQYNGALASYSSGAVTLVYNAYFNGGSWLAKSTGSSNKFGLDSNGSFSWQQATSVTGGSAFTYSTPMTLDASGNLLVGTTTSSARLSTVTTGNAVAGFFKNDASGYQTITVQNAGASGTRYLEWFIAGTTDVGSISSNGTSTTYSTSSDYRLKNSIAPMTGALAKVAALKPVTYKWNADGSDSEGFIAHELAEVCPNAVVGEKDAVDAEGNPVYQGIDTSFLVATLTAAIQELKASMDAVKAEFDAYKASHP